MRARRLVPCLLLLAASARAGALHVPADFPTIQAAVDAAQPDDEIVVAPGSYEERWICRARRTSPCAARARWSCTAETPTPR